MKKTLFLLLVFSLSLLPLHAQHGGHNCGNCPHHNASGDKKAASACCQQRDGLAAEIVVAFPTAKSVRKSDNKKVRGSMMEVYDAKKVLLGYAVYSKPASDGIKGYAGETPLMIALDTKQQIVCVQMLDNQETPGFLQKVVNAGLLKSWDGLKPAKAVKKQVDAVSGATLSSNSIIQSLQAALKGL